MASSTEASDTVQPTHYYYTRDVLVPFEEDAYHEFKGHLNLSVEEIPRWTVTPNSDRRTRKPVSQAINGFLNSDVEGTVYIGIIDSGCVKGVNLTVFRMDHVRASLDDLMHRYTPPVEDYRYQIKFVPVIDKSHSRDEIQAIVAYKPGESTDPGSRRRMHKLRTYDMCWCCKDAMAQYSHGRMAEDYVVEIQVKPWDPQHCQSKNGVGEMRAAPVYEDETGCTFFRRQASQRQYNIQELYLQSKQNVQIHYQAEIKSLREQLSQLRTNLPLDKT